MMPLSLENRVPHPFAASLLAVALGGPSGAAADTTPAAPEERVYVEYLWAPTPDGALARQPTRGFLLDGRHAHQLCVAAIHAPQPYRELRIDIVDAAGKPAGSQRHTDFREEKRCYAVQLDPQGTPGIWTFTVLLDGRERSSGTLEVARTLQEAEFHRPSGIPYVLGRPNYLPSIPADEYVGRLVWVMDVDVDGRVTDVRIETAEGVGERMRDAALLAGRLSLFPPDPSRATEPLRYRRELKFALD